MISRKFMLSVMLLLAFVLAACGAAAAGCNVAGYADARANAG